MQAAFHHRLCAVLTAHGHADLCSLLFRCRIDDRIARNVDAYLLCKLSQLIRRAYQRWRDDSSNGRLDRATERNIGERPTNGSGDRRKVFASFQKLVKDMEVRRMTY